MARPETQRIALAQRVLRCAASLGFGSLRISPLKRTLGACVLCALLVGSCQSAKSKQSAPVGSAAASTYPSALAAGGGFGQGPSRDNPAGTAGGEGAKVASPTALSVDRRAHLTTIRVSAHIGSVIIRRKADGWVISGADGCSVPPARLERALDNLMVLKAVPTNAAVPEGTAFQLQIDVLVGEKPALHLELADRNETGHLTRLDNDSMVRIQGLDLGLWSPHPADWCKQP